MRQGFLNIWLLEDTLMKIAGYVILALAVIHLAYAVVSGVTLSLGEDASAWEVFLHLVLHPIAALALVIMLLKPSALEVGWSRIVIGLLLAASIAGDVHVFLEVGDKGQSMLALVYALVPLVGLIYGVVVQIDRDQEAESRDR